MADKLQQLADSMTHQAATTLERRISRRGLLVRMTVVGSALTIAPMRYLLRPGSAWASTTCKTCANGHQVCCTTGTDCVDGNSTFCCSITGVNHCPSGTSACGWWRCCIPSLYCSGGLRYFIDCCGNCSGVNGHCENGACDSRVTCCYPKKWPNCDGSGTIQCRAMLCVLPSQVYSGCHDTPVETEATCCQGSTASGCPNNPSCCDTCKPAGC